MLKKDGKYYFSRKVDEKVQSRFRMLRDFLATFESESMARILDSFEENETQYLVMEWIETHDRQPLTWTNLKELFEPLIHDLIKLNQGDIFNSISRPEISQGKLRVSLSMEELSVKGNGVDWVDYYERVLRHWVGGNRINTYEYPDDYLRPDLHGPWTDVYKVARYIYSIAIDLESSEQRRKKSSMWDIPIIFSEGQKLVLKKAMDKKWENRYVSLEDFWEEMKNKA